MYDILMGMDKYKNCLICNKEIERSYENTKQWESRKYCSPKCLGAYHSRRKHSVGWHHPPEVIAKMKKNNAMTGNFTSNSYQSCHGWLRKNFTQDKTICEHCPSNRFLEFALKKGCEHEHKRENYLILCSSCHKRYDYTEERKEKMRAIMTGRAIPWHYKIAEANRGRIIKDSTKRKISNYQKSHPRQRNKLGQFYGA